MSSDILDFSNGPFGLGFAITEEETKSVSEAHWVWRKRINDKFI
jgi:hypothetical protein